MPDDAFWINARRHLWLDPARINLNSGTLFPTPIPILDAVNAIRRQMVTNPSDFVWRQLPPLLQRSRNALAKYLSCNAAELLLLPSVTYAINLVVASLRLPPGSEILTTDHEYGAMMLMLKRYVQENGLTLRQIKLPYLTEDPAEIVAAVEAGLSPQTRLFFFSHVNTTTGLAMPAAELCAMAKARGVLSLVDGAHAPGMIPVDLTQIGADFYAANCHKWLMAPAGAGFMHVAADRKAMLRPLITSWGWGYDPAKSEEDSGNGGTRWQWDMEFHGTADRCPQMVMPECLEFRQSLGGDEAILARCRQLSAYTRSALGTIGLKCATPTDDRLNGGALTAFDFPCDDLVPMRNRIWNEFGIECPITSGGGRTFLRVSTAWFNTTAEIDRLAAAIQALTRRP